MAGPNAKDHKNLSSEELLDIALTDLSKIFEIDLATIKQNVEAAEITNWVADPFTAGAYSYTKVETKDAYERLAEPINHTIYFAGEALCKNENSSTATVDGALESGKEVAEMILKD